MFICSFDSFDTIEFLSTILLNFGMHTRNWPRIDLQPLEFNSEFYVWKFRFAEFQQSQNRRSLYQA